MDGGRRPEGLGPYKLEMIHIMVYATCYRQHLEFKSQINLQLYLMICFIIRAKMINQ